MEDKKLYHESDDDDGDNDIGDALVLLLNNLKVLDLTENLRSAALPYSATRWQLQTRRRAWLATVLTFLFF